MSIVGYLAPGLSFRRGPSVYQARQVIDQDRIVIESEKGDICTLRLTQFFEEYRAGHIFDLRSNGVPYHPEPSTPAILSARWENASPAARRRASRAYAYVTAVERQGTVVFDTKGQLEQLLATAAREQADPKPPGKSTFFAWYKKYCRGGRSIEALLPVGAPRGLSRRTPRLPAEIVKFLNEQLDLYRQCLVKRTGKEWVAQVNAQIDAFNACVPVDRQLPKVSVSTWNRRIREIEAVTRVRAKHGKDVAERTHKGTTPVADPAYALMVVEIDHTRLQLSVLDPVTGKLHGEVWMTTMRCRRTRVILAFTLHVARHDHEVAMKCFTMAVLPKTNFKQWCPRATNDWPCFGVPVLLVCDNGNEFLFEEFARFCTRLGSNIAYAPVYAAEWKGSLERYHRTIKDSLIRRMVGAVPRASDSKVPRKPQKSPNAPTLEELTELVGRWIADVYHQEICSTTGMSPIDAWRRDSADVYIPMIKSVDDLLVRAGRIETRTLTRQGIEFEGDYYHSAALEQLVATLGTDGVRVRFVSHAGEAYRIFVIHPMDDTYLVTFNQNPGCLPEYSRDRWRTIKLTAKQKGLDVSRPAQRDTAAAIVEEANAAIQKSRKSERAAVARMDHVRSRSSSDMTHPPRPAGDQSSTRTRHVAVEIPDLPAQAFTPEQDLHHVK